MSQKMYQPPPPDVFKAVVQQDYTSLSHFGRRGAEKRKINLKATREIRHWRLATQLAGAKQMALQAHEDICPID